MKINSEIEIGSLISAMDAASALIEMSHELEGVDLGNESQHWSKSIGESAQAIRVFLMSIKDKDTRRR